MRSRKRWDGPALAWLGLAVVGCSDARFESETRSGMGPSGAAPSAVARSAASPALPADKSETPGEESKTPTATAGRKIIYNAIVVLVTEDLNALEAALTRLIETRKAYVADSDRSGSAGSTRQGTWKVRVPVEGYDAFLKGAVALGELVSVKADSQDVSEEFYDLQARETAKKVEETRLLKHLADSTGKLDEILAVERELSRVRIEIERMQGRLRALANLTSLATVTITASEIKGYLPPQAPTLSTRVGRTFASSVDSLRQFGETVLLAVVAIAPWLPLILIGLGIFVWLNRRVVATARRAIARTTDRPR